MQPLRTIQTPTSQFKPGIMSDCEAERLSTTHELKALNKRVIKNLFEKAVYEKRQFLDKQIWEKQKCQGSCKEKGVKRRVNDIVLG